MNCFFGSCKSRDPYGFNESDYPVQSSFSQFSATFKVLGVALSIFVVLGGLFVLYMHLNGFGMNSAGLHELANFVTNMKPVELLYKVLAPAIGACALAVVGGGLTIKNIRQDDYILLNNGEKML